eukprot:2913582-Alexandrium_andersonii.AAC.1
MQSRFRHLELELRGLKEGLKCGSWSSRGMNSAPREAPPASEQRKTLRCLLSLPLRHVGVNVGCFEPTN